MFCVDVYNARGLNVAYGIGSLDFGKEFTIDVTSPPEFNGSLKFFSTDQGKWPREFLLQIKGILNYYKYDEVMTVKARLYGGDGVTGQPGNSTEGGGAIVVE